MTPKRRMELKILRRTRNMNRAFTILGNNATLTGKSFCKLAAAMERTK